MSRGFGFARVYSLCFDSCQFFLVSYLVGRLAAKELHGASLISLAITLNPSRMSVKYVIGIWVRASACKCAEMRERSARICFNRLLLLMQALSVESPSRSRRKHGSW